MLEQGVYVIGFSFPVVPRGQARIRTQISAAHTPDDIETGRPGVRRSPVTQLPHHQFTS